MMKWAMLEGQAQPGCIAGVVAIFSIFCIIRLSLCIRDQEPALLNLKKCLLLSIIYLLQK